MSELEITNKTCTTCFIAKDIGEFYLKNKTLNIRTTQCKECVSKDRKDYYKINKKEIIENRKIYYEDNKSIVLDRMVEYRENNRPDINIKAKIYREDNKGQIAQTQKKYRENNREALLKYGKLYREENKGKLWNKKVEYIKERIKTDPIFKLRKTTSRMISNALKDNLSSKNGKSILEFLQYSMQDLKEHLENQFEPWMTWNNRGKYDPKTWNDNDNSTWTWQLDHIIPQSDLPFSSMQEDNFKKCWTLSNLRPLNSKLNLLDGVNRIRHKGNNNDKY